MRTVRRILDILYGPDEQGMAPAIAAWTTPPGHLWVSGTLRPLPPESTQPATPGLGHLLDATGPSGLVAMARAAAARGKVVAVCGSDGSLLAAVAADKLARTRWKAAALSVNADATNPGAVMVRRLLGDDALAVAATAPFTTRVTTRAVRRHSLLIHPAISAVLMQNLALRLRQLDPGLVHPLGGIATLLDRMDRTGGDLRLHLPATTSTIAPLPPDPVADEAGLRRWLLAQVGVGPYAPSRLLASIHAVRADLSDAFPDLSVEYWQIGFWRWVSQFGTDADLGAGLPKWATHPPRPVPSADLPQPIITRMDRGVQVIGYLEAALGLGEAARLAARALELAGEPVETVTYRHVVSPPVSFVHRKRPGQVPLDIQLVCLAGAALTRWNLGQVPTSGLRPYRIGLWFWETDRLSPAMKASLALVDEVWVTSAYTALAVTHSAPPSMPVRVVPLGAAPHRSPTGDAAPGSQTARRRVADSRPELQPIVNRRWCGFSFDLSSRLSRKNPLGLISAWCDAFPLAGSQPGDPVLIVKTVNGAAQPGCLAELQAATGSREDIVVVHGHWPSDVHHNFICALSLYASLHRSEGYGLVLLEAMACGVPVLATGASGNVAFMDASSAWLIPAVPTVLGSDDGPYPKGSVMFAPDHQAAVDALVALFSTDSALIADRANRVANALQNVAPLVDGSAAAAWMARRLAEIRQAR